jgi:branched-chain amino acid aminotransferase
MSTPYAYLRKQIVPLADAKIGIMTHAFMYGTGVFEGIRGNWNAEDESVYLFRPADHYRRLGGSARIIRVGMTQTVEELCDITAKLVEMSGFREDVYIRPIAYKSGEVIGPRVNNVEDDLLIFVIPFGAYLDTDKGIRCMTSSWRRVDDTAIPARAKVNGIYVNSSLAKSEALDAGFDEAIMLNNDGHVSEGSGENIVLVRNGKLITPSPSDNILEGITLDTVVELAQKELGIEVIQRTIDRSELYIADEVFMTGTAAHVTAVIDVDNRTIGDGAAGPITKRLQEIYFRVIHGRDERYMDWCTPVPIRQPVPQT